MSGACEYIPPKQEQYLEDSENKRLEVIRLIAMALVVILIAWLHVLPSQWISNTIIVVAVIVGGYPIFKESFSALKKGRINMELSMVIAIIASLLLFQFLPAIVITFFALLSEFIEEFIVEKGRKNIDMLYKRAPKKAIVKMEQNEIKIEGKNSPSPKTIPQEIPVEDVKIGDIVIAREGDVIPIDGQIMTGTSTIDQSTITGESIPVEKNIGDSVFAGTINLSSKLEIHCKKVSTDTTYAKIIHLVEESESSKAPIQKLSDKMATRLIQFAIGLSILTFIITQNIVSTLSVIVVAGACGLAVGTPIALLASNSKLAKNGIIVKGGIQIENIKNSGTIVFDKTGTLTIGRPTVNQIISFNKSIEPRKVLEYAAIAERDVNHPLAKAIVEKSLKEKIEINVTPNSNSNGDYTDYNSTHDDKITVKVGRGVSLFYDGQRISVGNIKFIEEQFQLLYNKNIKQLNPEFPWSSSSSDSSTVNYLSSLDQPTATTKESNNCDNAMTNDTLQVVKNKNEYDLLFNSTTVIIALDKEIIGAILLEDELRFGSKEVILKIKSMGLQPIMLTGDNQTIAKKLQKNLVLKNIMRIYFQRTR
ncbi:MAG: HAD-IC family P-type ATPase [Candidatus Nitrosocosmicus sp.]